MYPASGYKRQLETERNTKEIKAHHEWGTLKEAVVGTAESLRVPDWSDEYEFVTQEIQQFINDNQGKLLKEDSPSTCTIDDWGDHTRAPACSRLALSGLAATTQGYRAMRLARHSKGTIKMTTDLYAHNLFKRTRL